MHPLLPALTGTGLIAYAVALRNNPQLNEFIKAHLAGRQKTVADIAKNYAGPLLDAQGRYGTPWEYLVGIIYKESRGLTVPVGSRQVAPGLWGTPEPAHQSAFPSGTPTKYWSSYGLMQVSWLTAGQEMKLVSRPEDLTDPATNIRAGAAVLRSKYDVYNDWNRAVMAYNGTPNTPTTTAYLAEVVGAVNDLNVMAGTSPASYG